MSLTPLNGAVVTGSAWGFRSGGITAVQFDVTFTAMGTGIIKFKISNVPDTEFHTLASGIFEEKIIVAGLMRDGSVELYSDYGPGRYMGYFLCFA